MIVLVVQRPGLDALGGYRSRWGVWSWTLQPATVDVVNEDEPREIHTIVGERLKAAREASGVRQEEIAGAMTRFGFTWGRSSVSSLEAGKRKLSVEELMALPMVCQLLKITLPPLIQDGDRIKLSASNWLWGHSGKMLLDAIQQPRVLGRRMPELGDRADAAGDRATSIPLDTLEAAHSTKAVETFTWVYYVGSRIWPRLEEIEVEELFFDIQLEVVQKLATRSQVPPEVLTITGYGLWGHSIKEERDLRAARGATFTSKRSEQSARGHVTRELTSELMAGVDTFLEAFDRHKDDDAYVEWMDALLMRWSAETGMEIGWENVRLDEGGVILNQGREANSE